MGYKQAPARFRERTTAHTETTLSLKTLPVSFIRNNSCRITFNSKRDDTGVQFQSSGYVGNSTNSSLHQARFPEMVEANIKDALIFNYFIGSGVI